MGLSSIRGVIRRRMLVNFRVDAEVMQRQLPEPFRPKLLNGSALAGICLIRLEQMRPSFVPLPFGFASENAAHRVAVCWTDAQGEQREGVYIPRRDSGSLLNYLAGGRVFPGQPHRAHFKVRERDGAIRFQMRSHDGSSQVRLQARDAAELPATSHFASLQAASDFFAGGSSGFSATSDPRRLEGLCLCTNAWHVEPLAVDEVYSSYFADEHRFPKGSVQFDCALIMRDIPHSWQRLADLGVRQRDVSTEALEAVAV